MNLSIIIATMKEGQENNERKIALLELINEGIKDLKRTAFRAGLRQSCDEIPMIWEKEEKLGLLLAGVVECTDIDKMYELGFLEDIEE